MKILSIVTIPNPKLLEATHKVASFDKNLKEQIQTMRQVLKSHDGAGLAANQVDFANQVLIVELEDGKKSIPFQVFINPEIVECSKETDCLDEGCLSVPEIELPVQRAKKIKIRFQDEDGKIKRLTAKDILARVLQHETDHLQGIVFTSRIKDKYFRDFPELKKIKIAFVGSGEFGVPVLEWLIIMGFNPLIITEKAKIAGRGQQLALSPIAQLAERFGKKYIESESASDYRLPTTDYRPDLLICADFGQKIPEEILRQPKIGAFNLHPSLLPRHRGASPIPSTILSGDKETGVTIIRMSPEFDQGPIVAQLVIEASQKDNALELEKKLAIVGLKLLFEVLPKIVAQQLEEIPQDETPRLGSGQAKATYSHKLKKEDGEINWQEKPALIERKIRAFYPWPGSYTILPDGKRLIIHKSHLNDDPGGDNCKVRLDIVQPEGKKAMKWEEFLRGYRGEKPGWFSKIK